MPMRVTVQLSVLCTYLEYIMCVHHVYMYTVREGVRDGEGVEGGDIYVVTCA